MFAFIFNCYYCSADKGIPYHTVQMKNKSTINRHDQLKTTINNRHGKGNGNINGDSRKQTSTTCLLSFSM